VLSRRKIEGGSRFFLRVFVYTSIVCALVFHSLFRVLGLFRLEPLVPSCFQDLLLCLFSALHLSPLIFIYEWVGLSFQASGNFALVLHVRTGLSSWLVIFLCIRPASSASLSF